MNSFDVCHLEHIYNEKFQYSLPETTLKGYLSGKAFDYPLEYTENESKNLREDINNIYQNIISNNPEQEKIAFITAGALGAGKTVHLNQEREKKFRDGKYYAYVCPDDVCLKNQKNTYQTEIENNEQTFVNHKNAYDKWRPGSNAATHLILGNLIRENYGFYFGSTSTSPMTGKFFEFLKKNGYKIHLIHISAPDNVRWESIQERDKTFIQSTEKDSSEKGLLFPQRIYDTYLKYADQIDFYYRAEAGENAVFAAKWLRNEEEYEDELSFNDYKTQDSDIFASGEESEEREIDQKDGSGQEISKDLPQYEYSNDYDDSSTHPCQTYSYNESEENASSVFFNPRLHILNEQAYEKIKALHNQSVKNLQKNDLEWESTVEYISTKIIGEVDD